MESKSLVYGLIGFLLGGLLVSVAATTFNKPTQSDMTITQMTDQLKNKSADTYDAAFIDNMIMHHQSAIDMARLSPTRAKHSEIKQLSLDIIAAQEKKISQMRSWQHAWKYQLRQEH